MTISERDPAGAPERTLERLIVASEALRSRGWDALAREGVRRSPVP